MKRLLLAGLACLCFTFAAQPALAVTPGADSGTGEATVPKEGCVEIGVKLNDKDCIGSDEDDENPIFVYARGIIKFASGIFGLLIILTIVISAIQYITSQGYPDQLKSAQSRLTNAVVGLILFILAFGILEWLIPGNIFG